MRIFQAISILTATGHRLFGLSLIGRSLRDALSPSFRERAAGLFGPGQRPAWSFTSFLNHNAAERRPLRVAVAVLLLVLLADPVTALGQQDPASAGQVLTLEQAIALALKENHLVKNRELGVRKAGDALAAARTFRLPSMNLYAITSGQLVENEINIANPVPNIFPGVEPFFSISVPRRFTMSFAGLVLEPLSQQYRIGLNIQQARLAQDVEAQALRLAQQATVDKVKLDYYGILQSQSALESIQEAIKLYRELDRVTGDYVARQVSLRADSLEVKTRLAKAEYEALNLSNQLATQKEQLNNLLGRDIRTEYTVSAVANAGDFGLDLAQARSRALDRRPELREARLKLRQAEIERRIKKSEYIPDVSFGFAYTTFRKFDNIIPRNFASLGFVMKWEVFDWGRKRHELAESDKGIEQARNWVHEIESLILIDVGDKFRKLQQTRQALIVAGLSQEAAREGLRVNTNKYRLTAALLSDVLQSQASLAEANHQYQQAILAYWTARAEFEKAIGEEK
jgi:outer membrane protein TolC